MQTELEAYATQRIGRARKVAAARDASAQLYVAC